MSDSKINVLLVEDSMAEASLLKRALAEAEKGFAVTHVEEMAAAETHLCQGNAQVVLLDLSLPDSRGLATVQRALAAAPHLPIVVLTGMDDEALAVEAVRLGAQDYLVKGEVHGWMLARSLRYAIERKRADEEIRQLNKELEHRVGQRTAQLRAMSYALSQAEQRERQRLAQVLHDHLQQLLVAAKLHLGSIQRHADDDMKRRLAEVEGLISQSIDASRSLTLELSPPVLHRSGLAAALRWLGGQMRDKHRLEVHIDANADDQPQSADVAVMLFQFVRELLFNIVKHAEADRAEVRMCRLGSAEVQITVVDQGRGFDPSSPDMTASESGFGLFSIRERLQAMGGRMDVDSAPGRGTRVALTAPLRMSSNRKRR